MGVDIGLFRARIGLFSGHAVEAQIILHFINKSNILQFLSLFWLSPTSITFAIYIHFCIDINTKLYRTVLTMFQMPVHAQIVDFCVSKYLSSNNFKADMAQSRTVPVNVDYTKLILPSAISFFLFTLDYLLLCSGDIETNPGPVNNQGDLSVVHVNVCSIKNKMSEIEAESDNFDIITLSETWLSDSISNNSILLTNFHPPIRRDRPNDPHGGVAIYVKNNLYCKPRPDLNVTNLEAVWVETKLRQESILIGSFYRPPSANVQYWELLHECLEKVNSTNTNYILLGDFNTDWLTRPSPYLLNLMNAYGLKQFIKSPTRVTATTSTCLDLVLTQSEQLIAGADVLPSICSDHSVSCVYLKQPKPKRETYKRTIYNYNKLDEVKFHNLLSNVDWNNIINNNDINEGASKLTNTFLNLAKQCMPVKTVTVRTNDAPWINEKIRESIATKKRIHKLAKRTNSDEDWAKFRRCRNDLTSEIRKTKKEYIDKLDKKASDPNLFGTKDWWNLVKTFMSNKNMQSDEIPPIESQGNIYYTSKDKAEIFNDHFISQSTLPNNDDPEPDIPISNNIPKLEAITISEQTVRQRIKNLKSNKAVGPDLIHNRLLKSACDHITPPLTNFFNKCLNECLFPDMWKIAHITPIHKKGPKELCTNYRPISLLSCVGKLFESCVYKYVFEFLKGNNILTKSQSGFIPNDSCVNQLLHIYNELLTSHDKGITSQAVYLDITKAFDRVWHRGLLVKLSSVGIRGPLLLWFNDYLFNRKQATVIKGYKSDLVTIPAGVPQGSVLGPLLFLIYINDIVDEIESSIKLFADDTSISLSIENPVTRSEMLNRDLSRISEWGTKWKIVFNETKTELLSYSYGNDNSLPLTFIATQLEPTTHHKHLGIVLQKNLKWDFHIQQIIEKVTPLILCLKSYKYRFGRKTLETLYKSFILPIFDYADVIWDNCTQTLSNSLEELHLDALRTITGSVRGTSHHKLYSESGFCNLKERRRRHKIILFKKLSLGLCPEYLAKDFPPLVSSVNPYHRRRPYERKTPTFKTELYRNSFFPSTTLLWNDLPQHLQQSTSLSEIKRFLKQDDPNIAPYYYFGNRIEQIVHCRLRLQMSDLNNDLFNRHLRDNPSCSCGHSNETAEHYLLHCKEHTETRHNTIYTLSPNMINLQTLLFGSHLLDIKENSLVFASVHEFISHTKRFEQN